ncbi:DUF7144 family membrane protein [Streptomyces sp. 12297]|uniref:DUF7144 family membrane protein n=1 Tax=Streptomyces sp. NBC_00239 TaxID=2903640 RepID=UPI002E297CC3|nr:hypothetical protein [Streptomyces sp. NBC_00239]
MTQTSPTPPAGAPRGNRAHDDRYGWAAGGTVFAGILLLVDGILGVLKGIAGIAEDDVYARLGNYVFEFDVTAWGWILLILGVILIIVGIGLLKGAAMWARVLGVAVAGFSIIVNFMWLPYTPVWALISIGIGVFVIWALCTNDRHSTA